MAFDEQQIETRIDRVAAGEIEVSRTVGGVAIRTMAEVFEFAKMMAVAQIAVPVHLRGSPGACLAICVQAFEWQMSPFAVANKSYSVNNRLAYESQLIHAVVEARAPLEKRLRDTYEGEGDDRTCTISGTLKGDATPFTITSPKIKDIGTKNSPLWKTDPDQQLFYYTSRAWARRYVPDVLLGIYSKDELEGIGEGPGSAVDVTPGAKSELGERIAAGKGEKRGRGFDAGAIERTLEHKPSETTEDTTEVRTAADTPPTPTPPAKEETVAVVAKGAKAAAKAAPTTAKRSHKKKGETETPTPPPPAAETTEAKEDAADATVAKQRIEEIRENPESLVTGEELKRALEEISDEPTEAQKYAEELLVKVQAFVTSDECTKLDDLKAYKATMRATIDGLGLSADDLDLVRGRFTTIMLEAERALAKRRR